MQKSGRLTQGILRGKKDKKGIITEKDTSNNPTQAAIEATNTVIVAVREEDILV